MSVASCNRLTVRYGSFVALQDLTLDIPEGCIGLLGPNGAGKTTLLKTMMGFLPEAGGSCSVLGYDVKAEGAKVRCRIGLMPEQDCHIPGMTAVGFVAYAGELAGMPKAQALRRAHEVLEYCGLGEARYRTVETYSTGMLQRIKFAQALVHGPKLLLLDEPTNGLDPAGRIEMLELIRSVSHGKGLNVLISSHLLPDIERICDQVIVLVAGQVRSHGLLQELKKIEGHPIDVELREPSQKFLEAAQAKGFSLIHGHLGKYRFSSVGAPEDALNTLVGCAKVAGAQVRGFAVAERSLEDAFMEAIRAK